jgi:outer membrane protein assembly factor BamB
MNMDGMRDRPGVPGSGGSGSGAVGGRVPPGRGPWRRHIGPFEGGDGGRVGPGVGSPRPTGYGEPPFAQPYHPPPSPGPPRPPPTAGRPNRRPRWLIPALAGAAVLISVVAAAVMVIGRGGGGVMKGEIAWSTRFTSNNPVEMAAIGSWFVDGVLVRGTHAALLGYDPATGQQRWRIDAPAGQVFCGMSSRTDNGLGAVSVARSAEERGISGESVQMWHCENMWAIDARAGTVRTKTQVPPPKQWFDQGEASVQPEVVGGVAVLPIGMTLNGYNAPDGRRRWSFSGELSKDLTCHPDAAMAGGSRLVTLWSCTDYSGSSASHYLKVAWVDPASGKVTWSDRLPVNNDQQDLANLAFASPPVVVIDDDSRDMRGRVLVLNDAGHVAADIAQRGPYGTLDLKEIYRSNRLTGHNAPLHTQRIYNLIVGGGMLLMRASAAGVDVSSGDTRLYNGVVAFDTGTGKVRWSTRPDEESPGSISFVTMTDDRVIVLRDTNNRNDPPPRPFSLAPSDGAPTALGPQFPQSFSSLTNSTPMLYWSNNILYAVQWDNLSPERAGIAISALS